MDRIRKLLEKEIEFDKSEEESDIKTLLEKVIKLLEEVEADESEEKVSEKDEEESSVNIPISGSPLYPRIFTGDSAKPLQGMFPESEYVDDNIHTTWLGLMSYYG